MLHADWSMKIILHPPTNQRPGIAGEAPPFRDSGLAGGAIFGRIQIGDLLNGSETRSDSK
jgi:hypothetical protein